MLWHQSCYDFRLFCISNKSLLGAFAALKSVKCSVLVVSRSLRRHSTGVVEVPIRVENIQAALTRTS
jgi:hypothetical protein